MVFFSFGSMLLLSCCSFCFLQKSFVTVRSEKARIEYMSNWWQIDGGGSFMNAKRQYLSDLNCGWDGGLMETRVNVFVFPLHRIVIDWHHFLMSRRSISPFSMFATFKSNANQTIEFIHNFNHIPLSSLLHLFFFLFIQWSNYIISDNCPNNLLARLYAYSMCSAYSIFWCIEIERDRLYATVSGCVCVCLRADDCHGFY